MTSRIIVRNLPNTADSSSIESHISAVDASLTIADVRIVKTAEGKSRQFAFVGFCTEAAAKEAVAKLNRTYFGSRRLEVSLAYAPGDEAIPRPWTKLSPVKPESSSAEDVAKELEILKSHMRLLVLNLPYSLEETGLKEVLPDASDIHICRQAGNSQGRAFVQFPTAETALEAREKLHGKIHFGRIIRVKAADPPRTEVSFGPKVGGGTTSAFKRRKAEILAKSAEQPHNWNLLYVSANSAVVVAGEGDDSKRRKLLKIDEEFGQNNEGDHAAVDVALAEQNLIAKTRAWLKTQNINLKAFERSGFDLLKARPTEDRLTVPRSTDTFLLKHLPARTEKKELYDLLARTGPLVRLDLAPSGTVAIAQYRFPRHAKLAFVKFAYAPFKDSVLYLEWAAEDIYNNAKPEGEMSAETGKIAGEKIAGEKIAGEIAGEIATEDEELAKLKELLDSDDRARELPVSIHVQNLSFTTSEDGLRTVFEQCDGFLSAAITKRKKLVKAADGTKKEDLLSAGYGFIEFRSLECAERCLERMQNVTLDGHALVLKVSHKSPAIAGRVANVQALPAALEGMDISKVTNKLTVRNLAFQATSKELRKLFGTFGNVVAVRIPKNAEGRGRGFAFVEMATRSEVVTAIEALQSTHLYGRKLILEPAKASSEEQIMKGSEE